MPRHPRYRTLFESLEPRQLLAATPTDISLSTTLIPENKPANSILATLSTADADLRDTFKYTLVSGAGDDDNALFSIAGSKIKAKIPFNFEFNSSYSILLRTTDKSGLFFEKAFTITVTDINEAPLATPAAFITNPNSDLEFVDTDFINNVIDSDTNATPHALAKIKIVALPAHGVLKLDGTLVKANQEILAADLGFLAYIPKQNYTGPDKFKWTPSDGALYAKSSATYAITVSGPLVFVYATKSAAAEFKNVAGVYTFKRQGGNLAAPLDISYFLTGTSTDDGSDYTQLPGIITIPAGKTSATVSLIPVDDFEIEGSETVVVNILPGGGYYNGINLKDATITIADHNRKITLGTFAPLAATQNTPLTISFDDIIAAAGASDPESEPLTIKIKSVTKGTLTKNAAPIMASTTTLATGEELEWTPPTDTLGALSAFAITISDGVNISSPIFVKINVGVVAPLSFHLAPTVNGTITDTDGNGTFDSLTAINAATQGLAIRQIPGIVVDHPVVEFNFGMLPAGAVLDGVTFNFDEGSYANNVGTIKVLAYAGNGAVSLSDATTAAAQVGSYDAIALGLGEHAITLDAGILQTLRASGDFIGLRFEGAASGVNTSFASIEQGAFFAPPSLDLTYHISNSNAGSSTTINPLVDGTANDADGNGSFGSVNTSATGLTMRNFTNIVIDRAMLEFSLAAIPAGKTFDSVDFTFYQTSFTSSSSTVSVIAYAADGAISLADASVAGVIAGNYDPVALGNGEHTISLNAATLQTLFASNTIIGLRLQAAAGSVNTGIASSETLGFSKPILKITYH